MSTASFFLPLWLGGTKIANISCSRSIKCVYSKIVTINISTPLESAMKRVNLIPAILFVALGCSNSVTIAQPTRTTDGKLQALLPTRVVVIRNTTPLQPGWGGGATDVVETQWVDVPEGQSAASMRPPTIPIFTQRPDGSRVDGIEIANDTDASVQVLINHEPILIQLSGSDYSAVAGDHYMTDSHSALYPPRWNERISLPTKVRICYEPLCVPISLVKYPSAVRELRQNFFSNLATRVDSLADMESLDVIGWPIDPSSLNY